MISLYLRWYHAAWSCMITIWIIRMGCACNVLLVWKSKLVWTISNVCLSVNWNMREVKISDLQLQPQLLSNFFLVRLKMPKDFLCKTYPKRGSDVFDYKMYKIHCLRHEARLGRCLCAFPLTTLMWTPPYIRPRLKASLLDWIAAVNLLILCTNMSYIEFVLYIVCYIMY